RPEERAPKSGPPDFGIPMVSKSATPDFDSRVSKDGHKRGRAGGHPSRRRASHGGPLVQVSPVRCNRFHGIDPLGGAAFHDGWTRKFCSARYADTTPRGTANIASVRAMPSQALPCVGSKYFPWMRSRSRSWRRRFFGEIPDMERLYSSRNSGRFARSN